MSRRCPSSRWGTPEEGHFLFHYVEGVEKTAWAQPCVIAVAFRSGAELLILRISTT